MDSCIIVSIYAALAPEESAISHDGDFWVFPTLICSLSICRSLHFLNSTCFPMRDASPDKEEENKRGIEQKENERKRRASGWSYSLITCLPCKCSSKELHPWLQKTALLFQIIKYWPIKVRTWGQASSALSFGTSSSSSLCPHFIAFIPLSVFSLPNHPVTPASRPTFFSMDSATAIFVCCDRPTQIESPGVKTPQREGLKVIKLAISYSHRCVRRGRGRRGRRKGSGTSLQHCTWLLLSVIGLYRPSL